MPAALDSPAPSATEPRLQVFFGLIATGKSTLARAWAARHGREYYNSDVVRKELAGLDAATRCREEADRGIYTPEFSRRTYAELLQRAAGDLRRGRGVILDASYLERAERDRVAALAQTLGVPVDFVLCECSDEVKRERLAIRARDSRAVSDGSWAIYLRQREKFQPPTELKPEQLVVIDTARPLEQLLAELARLLA
jgi:uncharacterized protein